MSFGFGNQIPTAYHLLEFNEREREKANLMEQTVAHALKEATNILKESGVECARRDANLLLGNVLEKNLAYLIAHDDELMSFPASQKFYSLIERRASGQPLQYILGKQEFFGLEFEVNENVLIPRPETELLIEIALQILHKEKSPTFCDVGTGSGCISIALLKNLPQAIGVALDVSPEALKVAWRNAERHDVQKRIEFYESDVFAVFQDPQFKIQNPKFSLIVSNPPYIPISDLTDLQREVRDFEPHSALFAGADGFDIIRRLLADAPNYLAQNGFLVFEIGFGQSEQTRALIDDNVWFLREILQDLQNIPRVVVLEKKC